MPYKTRQEMIDAWNALATTYPAVCSSEVLGQSVQARDIKLFKIGNPLGGRLALVAGLHGEEVPSQEIVYQFALWVCSSSDADAVRIRERNYLLIVPMLCLDKYDISSVNANGVNLYYNFDYDFGSAGTDYGEEPTWQYRGPSALSEPESVILKRFFTNWKPHIELACHDGTSDKDFYAPGGADAADLAYLEKLHKKYIVRALRDNAITLLYGFIENTTGGGRPEACAYYHNDKKVLGTLLEMCVNTVTYDSIATTWYPNAKPLLIVLAQACELYTDPQEGPAVELTFGSVEVPDEDVVSAEVVDECTGSMASFKATVQNWDEKYSPGGTYPLTKGLAATVKIGRGSAVPQMLVGRIEEVNGAESAEGEHYLTLFGRSSYEETLRLEVDEYLLNKKAELLIEYLIEKYTTLEHLIADADDDTPAFSACTEVDPNSHITLADHRLYISGIARNEDAYVYKDFGAGAIDDFEFWLDIRGKGGGVYGACCFGSVGPTLDDFYGWVAGSNPAVTIVGYNDNGSPMKQVLKIQESYGGAAYDSSTASFTLGQVLFCIFRKLGTSVWLEIYTDAERTQIAEVLSLTLHADHTFQYFMPCQSYNNASALAFNGYVGQASLVEPSDTTFTVLDLDSVPLNDVLLDAANASDRDGVIGFEIRTTPSGKFQFFPVGAKVKSDVNITEILQKADWKDSVSRIRNKIRVNGAYLKQYPDDLDSWTESLTGWTATSGLNLQLDGSIKRKGNYSIYIATPGGGGLISLYRTFDPLRKYQIFTSWFRVPGNLGGGYFRVRLLAPDDSNYFEAELSTWLEANCIGAFGFLMLNLGPKNMYDADKNPTGSWTMTGEANWRKVSGLRVLMNSLGATSYLNIDGDIGFQHGPYTALAEDLTSQGLYGIRERTFQFEDLFSDAECALRASALLEFLAESAQSTETESEVFVYADKPLLAADTVHHHIGNLNVDGDYRVNRIVYQAFGGTEKKLVTSFSLGNVPKNAADWLHALRKSLTGQATYRSGPPY